MSTYLVLCQKTRQLCRIPGTGPTAVTGQTGIMKDIVEEVADSWSEIQGRTENWEWMKSTFTVNTVSGTAAYAGSDCTDSRLSAAITQARFNHWIIDDDDSPPKIYLTSEGVAAQRFIYFWPWEQFERIYRIAGQNTATGQPAYISIDPQLNFVLGPTPDAVYTVTGNYQRGVQTMTADGCT